jgi:uncharacterized protein involved in exopolysaccharide biosynthesis/Mrp family chromosome partitioning ATPase
MENRLLTLLKKEKRIILTGISMGLGLFAIYLLFFYVPVYKTGMKLFIRNIPQNDIVTTYDDHSDVESESGYSNPLFNYSQILQSQKLSSGFYKLLVKKYPKDLRKLRINDEKSWDDLYGQLVDSKIEPSTDIINVSLNWPVKNNAAPVLKDLISKFKQVNLQIRKSVETEQREYLDRQIDSISSDLTEVRNKIKNYRLQNSAVDLPDESTELIKTRMDLEKQQKMLQSEIYFNDRKLKSYLTQLGVKDPEQALRATGIGEDAYLIKISQDLATAQQNYYKLQAKFTDNYPDVIAAKNEIALLNRKINERKKETLSNIKIPRGLYDKPSQDIVTDMSRVQADSVSIKEQLKSLESGISELKTQENSLPVKMFNLDELKKQEEALLLAYTSARQKQMEAKIRENQIVDNITSLGDPETPSFLSKIIISKLFGFVMLGFLLSLGVVWVKQDIEDKWLDSGEIELVTGKRVLGVIPWLTDYEKHRTSLINEPDSLIGISYTNIASNIISKSYLEEVQSLCFISTNQTKGKSSILANICNVIAKSGRNLVLIDTDYTNSSKLIREFNIENSPGLDLIDLINEVNKQLRLNKTVDNNVILNLISKAIVPIRAKHSESPDNKAFFYIFLNKVINNIYDYTSSRGFKAIIDTLKMHNEFIFIETPARPFVFPEVQSISEISDAVVLLSAMETNRAELIKTVEKFDRMERKILGIIPRAYNSELSEYFADEASGTSYSEQTRSIT